MYGIANGLVAYYDTDNNTYGTFYNNKIEYHYCKSMDDDFYNTFVQYTDGYGFSISAHLPKREFVKIAENLKK